MPGLGQGVMKNKKQTTSEDVVLETTVNIHMQECKWFPVCPMKRFYKAGNLNRIWIYQSIVRAIGTLV